MRHKITLGCILLFILGIRLIHLDADTPWGITWSEGIVTDGSWYLDMARSWVKDVTPSVVAANYHREFFSIFAYVIFKIFGFGVNQATLISVLSGCLCVLFLGLTVYRVHGPKGMVVVTPLLGLNSFFFVYNRSFLIYSTVAAAATFCVWVWQKGFDRKIYFAVAYILILLFTMHLKVILLVLFPILLFVQLYVQPISPRFFLSVFREHKVIVISFSIYLLVTMIFFFKKSFYAIIGRFRSYGANFSDLQVFLDNFINVVQSNDHHIFKFMLMEVVFACMFIIFRLYRNPRKLKMAQATDLSMLLLFVVGTFSFFLFRYHPPRYYVFIIPSIVYLACGFIMELFQPSSPRKNLTWRSKWAGSFLIFLLIWLHICFHFQAKRNFSNYIPVLGFAILLSGLCAWVWPLFHRYTVAQARKWLGYLLLATCLFIQGLYLFLFLWKTEQSIQLARKEIQLLIPSSSIVAGPYAHVLGFESEFEKQWVGLPKVNAPRIEGAFRMRGVTHLLLDSAVTLKKIFHSHATIKPHLLDLGSIFVRGKEMKIYRFLPHRVLVSQHLTPFEKKVYAMNRSQFKRPEQCLWNLTFPGPTPSLVFYQQARCMNIMGQPKEVVRFLGQTLKANRYQAWAWRDRGILAMKNNQVGKALFDQQMALRYSAPSRHLKARMTFLK